MRKDPGGPKKEKRGLDRLGFSLQNSKFIFLMGLVKSLGKEKKKLMATNVPLRRGGRNVFRKRERGRRLHGTTKGKGDGDLGLSRRGSKNFPQGELQVPPRRQSTEPGKAVDQNPGN